MDNKETTFNATVATCRECRKEMRLWALYFRRETNEECKAWAFRYAVEYRDACQCPKGGTSHV